MPVGADEWVAVVVALATRSMMSTYRKNDCQKKKERPRVGRCRHWRSQTMPAETQQKPEDGRWCTEGIRVRTACEPCNKCSKFEASTKNVTQISNALWERHWERERVGNEVEVAPFALRHAGVLLCVGVCLSLSSVSFQWISCCLLCLLACDAADGDVFVDCETLSSLQCQPKTECMSSVPTEELTNGGRLF